jgi:hypothetical protein
MLTLASQMSGRQIFGFCELNTFVLVRHKGFTHRAQRGQGWRIQDYSLGDKTWGHLILEEQAESISATFHRLEG